MSSTVWVDITSAMSFQGGRLTGIPRVELEVALRLSERLPVEFVRFDHRRSTFVSVPAAWVNERYHELSAEQRRSFRVGPERLARLRSRLEDLAYRAMPRYLRTDRVVNLARTTGDASVTATTGLVSLVAETIRLTARRARRAEKDMHVHWAPGDTYLCLTLHRSPDITALIDQWATAQAVRVVTMVYDLIPVVAPQFSTYDEESQRALFRSAFQSASHLIAISHNTAHDVQTFCSDEGIAAPPATVVPPASAISHSTPQRPETPDLPAEFILCVGTIEPRKNHHLLFDLWEGFTRTGTDVPHLVIAGSIGWLNDETMHRLRTTPELRSSVTFVESPSDAELHWLYRNCLFTVYPSLYEGWGLPVSESLTAGKICVTSDRGSLVEAGEGLALHVDATDRAAWRSTVLGLHHDRQRLRMLEDRISRQHVTRTVDDVVSEIVALLD